MLVHLVDNIVVLTSHLVEDQIDTRLASFLGRLRVAHLLVVEIHVRSERRSRELLRLAQAIRVEIHALELLGREIEELLLELLLPLLKIHLRSHELRDYARVHLLILQLDRWWRQDLLWKGIDLLSLSQTKLVLASPRKARGNCSLRHPVIKPTVTVSSISGRIRTTEALLAHMIRSG